MPLQTKKEKRCGGVYEIGNFSRCDVTIDNRENT